MALGLLVSAQFVVMLDTSIVNVALPSIQTDLRLSATAVTWVVNAYVLAFGGLLLLSGRAADLFGRRRMFVAGSALFMVGTVLAARYSTTWIPLVLLAAVFFGILFWQSMVVEPRIKARRHALEAARDPVRAARCRRRERLLGWLACAVGFGVGGAALIAGLVSSGRLQGF
jgi:MFS family permease